VRHVEEGGRRRDVREGRTTSRRRSAIIVDGTARADARAPGGYEVDVTALEIVSEAKDYPITPKEHGVDYLMDRRHLWIRSQRQQAILRVRHEVINAGPRLLQRPRLHPRRHADLHARGVRRHDDAVPRAVLRGHDGVPHAERTALQRSERDGARPRLRVRADVPREKSKTRRHLTEFWMVEPEMAYATLEDVMALAEGLITYVVGRTLERESASCRRSSATRRSSRRCRRRSHACRTTTRRTS
jgi:asparaginyl-tRNA synthetase